MKVKEKPVYVFLPKSWHDKLKSIARDRGMTLKSLIRFQLAPLVKSGKISDAEPR